MNMDVGESFRSKVRIFCILLIVGSGLTLFKWTTITSYRLNRNNLAAKTAENLQTQFDEGNHREAYLLVTSNCSI